MTVAGPDASPASATDNATLAVVVARLDDLRVQVASLSDKLDAHRGEMVPRTEWMQRNATVDERFQDQGKDISDLRAELAARRAPWWSVVSAITAVVAVAVVIIQSIN